MMPGKKLAGCHGLGSPPDHRGLWMVERHPDDALDLASDGVVQLDLVIVGDNCPWPGRAGLCVGRGPSPSFRDRRGMATTVYRP